MMDTKSLTDKMLMHLRDLILAFGEHPSTITNADIEAFMAAAFAAGKAYAFADGMARVERFADKSAIRGDLEWCAIMACAQAFGDKLTNGLRGLGNLMQELDEYAAAELQVKQHKRAAKTGKAPRPKGRSRKHSVAVKPKRPVGRPRKKKA